MDKENIEKWANKYDREEDLDFPGFEKSLGSKIENQKRLSKPDIENILRWKFQGKLHGRGEYFIGKLQGADEIVGKLSSEALNEPNGIQTKMNLLDKIPGVGPAIISVILTFYDPQNYGILDIHAWRELFGKEPKNLYTNRNYFQLLVKLREIAGIHNLPVRIVEKALFKKNLDEAKQKVEEMIEAKSA